MAIYHLHAKIITRKTGRSVVASAAYRSSQRLHEESSGITHDYTRKGGVEHSEILAPENAPAWARDREPLWNAVEAVEKRRDAQLARDIEVGLPVELSASEQTELLRDFVRREFVAQGMVADFSIHRDNPHNPHAHILLTTREIGAEGFGKKARHWNGKDQLLRWREGWAERTNEHLARAGYAVRIDHRSYKEQGIALTPGRKIGIYREKQSDPKLTGYLADRIAEQREIALENGEKIRLDPSVALKAISHHQATFTHEDIAKFLHTRTEGAEQFQAAYLKVTTSKELVALGTDDRNRIRFTTREMIAVERNLLAHADGLAQRKGHGVDPSLRASALSQHQLDDGQRKAVVHLTEAGDLKVLLGVAGGGKSRSLAAAREAWEAQGLTVKGYALAGIAAQNLEIESGIQARTLASAELAWSMNRDPLTRKDVLVIDEAGMVGTQQLNRVLEEAHRAGSKVVLVGDTEQLQAIEAGAPLRAITTRSGAAEITKVRRQKELWQQEATEKLSRGETADALSSYEQKGAVIAVHTREQARTALLARWAKEGQTHRGQSRLMLAYTREDVKALNSQARELREQNGELGRSQTIETERGKRDFAPGERLYFLRNEKSLGVKNGSLGTLEKIQNGVLQVKLDGESEHRIAVDTRFYQDLDYGYAATVHKTQGSTLDRTYVLASWHYDRHTTYVGLSRHREAATLFYAREDFGGKNEALPEAQVRKNFLEKLSRVRQNDMAHDYLELQIQPQPARSIGERFQQGFAKGKSLERTAPPASAERAREADTPAARFNRAIEHSQELTLQKWEQQRQEQWRLEAEQRKQAGLELERGKERDRSRDLSR